MFLMKSLFFDPIMRIKETRDNKMSDDQAEIQALRLSLGKEQAEYDAHIKDARRKAQEAVIEVSAKAKSEASQTLGATRQKVREELDAKLAELAQWRESTYQQMSPARDELKRLVLAKVTGQSSASQPSSVLSANH